MVNKNDRMTFVLLILCALIFPPLAVYIVDGCNLHLLINIFLCLLFYFPGMIHSLYLICR